MAPKTPPRATDLRRFPLAFVAVSVTPSSVTVLASFDLERGDLSAPQPPVSTSPAAPSTPGAVAAGELRLLLRLLPLQLLLVRFFLRADGEGGAMRVAGLRRG